MSNGKRTAAALVALNSVRTGLREPVVDVEPGGARAGRADRVRWSRAGRSQL